MDGGGGDPYTGEYAMAPVLDENSWSALHGVSWLASGDLVINFQVGDDVGIGIDLARVEEPELAEAIDNMKDQLLIALVNKMGGDVSIAVSDIDDTGQYVLTMEIDQEKRHFHFSTIKKS